MREIIMSTSLLKLEDLYVAELRDLYDTEKQVLRRVSRITSTVTSPEFKTVIEDHLNEVKNQLGELETIFEGLGVSADGEKSSAKSLIKHLKEVTNCNAEPHVRDAALIVEIQKIEHYEIAAYGSTAAFANLLEYHEAEQALKKILEEEKQFDEKLTHIATSNINPNAERAPEPIQRF
jgi:ferritin-like metal-binding protein YciE